ncbi:DUF1430 domain-containing protein [Staphylococcus epidermidis]|uniref:DUF1430 domain-containing protein n=1 Tax=Staphylococcus epidermidis TaxID=1282 RepID=UPI00124E6DF6|nr:DUF1430 domain-containing protein [Staphylococcus epidermidis]KAB2300875.1 DUF1430 domain-containing protein [Staphylococcus epidermidis]
MKKLLLFLLVSITLIFSLGIANSAKNLSFYQTIIKDHDHFVYNVPGKEKKHTRDAPQYFNKIAKNHHVGLTKVTYFNDNRILFNTNEKRLLNQRDNHHQLHIFDSKMHIDVENITTTKHLSAVGMYYIKGDPKDKATVLSLMNKYAGDTIKQENPSLLSYLTLDQYTLALIFLLSLLIFIVYCHYLQRNKQNYKMLSDLGYDLTHHFMFVMRDLKWIFLSYVLLSIGTTLITYLAIYKDLHILQLLAVVCSVMVLTLIALSCITILLLMIYQKDFYKNQVKPNVNLIIYLYILLAIVMGVFLTTSTHQVIKNSHDFQSKIPSLKGWKNTKDVYQPNVQDNGAEYNKEIEIAQDKRFDRLLKSKENPGFLIDTENFTSEGGELPLYIMNEEENNSIEPDGKTIIVDPNYLKRHHMVTPQSEDVLRYIQHDKYTRNILVPIKFKRYEHKIRKNFTKDFKFKRTLYDDIRKDHAPAHINIIYVKNNSKYPTYNSDAGGKNNKIEAPIAIVETGNTHVRNNAHYMDDCYFFESKKDNPYDTLKPLLKKYGLLDDIISINSVYDTKVDDINDIKKEITKYVLLALITLISFIIAIFTAIHLYFVNWKHAIFIKYNLGYSVWNNHKYAFLLLAFVNILLLGMFLQKYPITSLLIFISLLIFEMIVISIEFLILNQKNNNAILKGKE